MLCPTLAPTPLIGVIFVCMNPIYPYLAGPSAMGCPLMTPVIPFGFLNVQLAYMGLHAFAVQLFCCLPRRLGSLVDWIYPWWYTDNYGFFY